jgi:PadR family transcriptional regulator PadR
MRWSGYAYKLRCFHSSALRLTINSYNLGIEKDIGIGMARGILGHFERQILTIVLRLGKDAYSAAIWREMESRFGGSGNIGSIVTTLQRMQRKGFVTSRWGEPIPARGGRRRRYYEILSPGLEALARTEEMMRGFDYDTVPQQV